MIKLRLYDGRILRANKAEIGIKGLILDGIAIVPYADIVVIWGRSGEV